MSTSGSSERTWLLVDDFAPGAYREAALHLKRLLGDPAATRVAARDLAQREFALETAIDRYHSLYMKVLGR